MRFSRIAALAITTLTSVFAFSPSFPYGEVKVRGVNLGGWLVLEPWITPSIFDQTGNVAMQSSFREYTYNILTGNPKIIDEWTFGHYQDHDVALGILKKHWDTWITEDDFAAIAAAGLNHVRIPIGYWAFQVNPDEPYVPGQLPYLLKAVQWAKKYNLKVIVDLHGAPGSQNGFDNSGQRLDTGPNWHRRNENVARTNAILKDIVADFIKESDTASVIAPLNEPAGFFGQLIINVTKQYWLDSYESIRYPYGDSTKSNQLVLIHDAFQGVPYWNGFMPSPKYEGVGLDTHIYQMFNDYLISLNETEHIKQACSSAKDIQSAVDMLVIVGEWTTATHDCAKYLNGQGVGARYDGTYPGSNKVGSCQNVTGHAENFSSEYKEFLRKMWEAQIVTFELGAGWLQWTWKAEIADEWTYKAGLEHGWIPQDPTNLKYPDICGGNSTTSGNSRVSGTLSDAGNSPDTDNSAKEQAPGDGKRMRRMVREVKL
ncbi:hypothetical protein VNI00_002106 [Paramarasmius palmivorus]|uniref:Glycoside hydrolase family 5 domain-containing protein n=1 Tax=Paramarasmius palmivorus TaxID=297713 RepID=A0AAW0E3W8_9AGAR